MMMIDAPTAINNNSVVFFDPITLPFAMTLVFVAIVLFMISKIGKNIAEAWAVNKSANVDADRAALDREKHQEKIAETKDSIGGNGNDSISSKETSRSSEDGSSSPAVEIMGDLTE